jgi:hypothetical protein
LAALQRQRPPLALLVDPTLAFQLDPAAAAARAHWRVQTLAAVATTSSVAGDGCATCLVGEEAQCVVTLRDAQRQVVPSPAVGRALSAVWLSPMGEDDAGATAATNIQVRNM